MPSAVGRAITTCTAAKQIQNAVIQKSVAVRHIRECRFEVENAIGDVTVGTIVGVVLEFVVAWKKFSLPVAHDNKKYSHTDLKVKQFSAKCLHVHGMSAIHSFFL